MTFYESNREVGPTGAEVEEYVDTGGDDEAPETLRRPSEDPEADPQDEAPDA